MVCTRLRLSHHGPGPAHTRGWISRNSFFIIDMIDWSCNLNLFGYTTATGTEVRCILQGNATVIYLSTYLYIPYYLLGYAIGRPSITSFLFSFLRLFRGRATSELVLSPVPTVHVSTWTRKAMRSSRETYVGCLFQLNLGSLKLSHL